MRPHLPGRRLDSVRRSKIPTRTRTEQSGSPRVSTKNPSRHSCRAYRLGPGAGLFPIQLGVSSPFLFSNLSRNPFTDTARKTDVDFIANTSSVVHIEIVLPKEIKVEELTKDKKVQVVDSSVAFIYQNEIKKDTIYINSSFEINKPIFEKTEYADLRKNFKLIYSLLSNPISLRRIEK